MFDVKDIALARLFKPDLSMSKLDAGSLALLKIMNHARGGGVIPVYDADISNGIASFSGVTKSKPLVSLLLNIPVTQTGSGTPSPDNIRDIVGVSQAVIGQTSDYGEYFRGLLNGTYGFVDLGTLTYSYSTVSGISYFRSSKLNLAKPAVLRQIANVICTQYEEIITSGVNYLTEDTMFLWTDKTLFIRDDSYTDPTAFKSAMNGVMLIYELAEPSTPVTPEQFATLCQAFGITGNTYQITFGQTVYSANLDVLTGKLSVTHGKFVPSVNDQLTGFIHTDNNCWVFTISSADAIYKKEGDAKSSINIVNYFRVIKVSGFCTIISTRPVFSLSDADTGLTANSTEQEVTNAYLNFIQTYDCECVYELAEPIEIDITPTVINTLIGENVIFADVADVTECKYTRK